MSYGAGPALRVDPNADFDVVVVGVGVIRLSSIFRLRRCGFRVRAQGTGDGAGGIWF